MASFLQTITLEQVIQKNNQYYSERPEWRLSETRPYKVDVMKWFIEEIRPQYTYVDEWSEGHWKEVLIKEGYAKYGTFFIYIDYERKLWRTNQTISEFYRGGTVD